MAGASGALIRNNSYYNITAHEERSKQANIACLMSPIARYALAISSGSIAVKTAILDSATTVKPTSMLPRFANPY
jgi:hypothetical protein